MNEPRRMSPLTAMFIGMFAVSGLLIAGASGVVLYAMRIVDTRVTDVFGLADHTIQSLPDLLESLPPAVGDLLNDRRAPEYIQNLDIQVRLAADERGNTRPVVTIRNNGDEVVSMLAVRVAALNDDELPIREWTEIVATPVAIDHDWRGPLMPHETRHVLMSSCCGTPLTDAGNLNAVFEISEVRVWESKQ